MFLFGEICPTSRLCRYGSRTEGHSKRDGITTEPYGAPGTACGGNTKRDWAEVSRGHSSFPAGRRGLNLVEGGAVLVSASALRPDRASQVRATKCITNLGRSTGRGLVQPMRLKGSERRIILVGYRCSLASYWEPPGADPHAVVVWGPGAKHPRLPD